jgi:DHA1 family multidrug resistance protein-like MFS transporter
MEVLIRESTFGRLVNYLSNDRFLPYSTSSNPSVSANSSTPETCKGEKLPPNLADWVGLDDPENPMNWSTLVKCVVMLEVMILNFSFYAAAAIFTPSIPGIKEEFDVEATAVTLGLSLFVIAYGIGPLIVCLILPYIILIAKKRACSSHHFQTSPPLDKHQYILAGCPASLSCKSELQ